MLKSLLLVFLCSFIFLPSFSQSYSSTNSRAIKAYESGVESSRSRQFGKAIEAYEKALKRDPEFWEAHLALGNTLEVLFDTTGALPHWLAVTDLGGDDRRVANTRHKLGMYYLRTRQLEEARAQFEAFLQMSTQVPTLQPSVEKGLAQIDFIRDAKANPVPFEPIILPAVLNGFDLQYFPVLNVLQDQFIFTGRRTNDPREDEDIYISRKTPDGWSEPESISPNINTPLQNEGTCTISADGRTLIFTSCQRRDVVGSCDLYVSYKRGEEWSTPRNMGRRINTPAWETQPSLSADGRTLYFVSRRRGGYGNSDIWVSRLQTDNTWGHPENLGPTINTPEDDLSPFIHVNGQTLYFASKGHLGMGGFDIFKSERQRNGWSQPENLGYPINDESNQQALFITGDGLRAFYGKETLSQTRGRLSRLYTFQLPELARAAVPSTYVFGRVLNAETGRPIGAWVDLIDLESDSVLGKVRSDPITGEYLMVLNGGAEYGLFTQSKGYLYNSLSFNFEQQATPVPVNQDIYLEPLENGKSVVMNNVFFDTDSYALREKSKPELNLAIGILRDNPEVRVEIAGHTDDVGSDTYNQELSLNRARSVYEYLISKGVPRQRLRFRGYGEAQPRFPNDSEANRQSNRRIEFVIYR
ncbi:MAG: OmpA family protein [Bacteroidota bacterium]